MGLGDEYSRDAFTYDAAWDSDESDEFDNELDPEDWQAMYSDEILDGWMFIREFTEERYMKLRANYPKFVELVMDPHKWFTRRQPTLDQERMWSRLGRLPIISERVNPENFYSWAENFVGYL
jgi:hypothetical protein